MTKIRVGQIGIGAIGRTHFSCYRNSESAELVALCDIDPRKLTGDWSPSGLNLGSAKAELVDMSAYRCYADWREIIADPNIDAIDVCLPIDLHAEVAIAALRAGKHVFCEKPMAHSSGECREMEAVAAETGKQLMIGHCLRYWPEYVAAQEIIASGEYGKPTYARFHRSGGTPKWSYEDWLRTASRSGGVVLDMHVHDVDAALWWFGKPATIDADGTFWKDLPCGVDASWRYASGLRVQLHSFWDDNEMPFRYSFTVVLENATLSYDSASAKPALRLNTIGNSKEIELEKSSAYQNELDDFYGQLLQGTAANRVTLSGSREAVEAVEEESRQIYAKSGRG
jgi:predicted dehydrogenase